jgi:hypothetical protein
MYVVIFLRNFILLGEVYQKNNNTPIKQSVPNKNRLTTLGVINGAEKPESQLENK